MGVLSSAGFLSLGFLPWLGRRASAHLAVGVWRGKAPHQGSESYHSPASTTFPVTEISPSARLPRVHMEVSFEGNDVPRRKCPCPNTAY
eukprot:scaffold187146_cov25-Tisochrysis_lutea.AAC.1